MKQYLLFIYISNAFGLSNTLIFYSGPVSPNSALNTYPLVLENLLKLQINDKLHVCMKLFCCNFHWHLCLLKLYLTQYYPLNTPMQIEFNVPWKHQKAYIPNCKEPAFFFGYVYVVWWNQLRMDSFEKSFCSRLFPKTKPLSVKLYHHFDGLVQDCRNSIANTLELLQSCTKPSILCHCVFVGWLILSTIWNYPYGVGNKQFSLTNC